MGARRPEDFRAPRGRACLVLVAVAFLIAVGAAACSPASEPIAPFPGRSTRPPGGPTAAPPSSARAPERWERWSELAGWRVAIERTPSQHLAADREAETLANEAAAAYPHLGPARRLGAGSVLVQRLYAPGEADPEVLFAMVRGPGGAAPAAAAPSGSGGGEMAGAAAAAVDAAGWEYLILAPDGFVAERGALEACVRCHAEAPHAGAFGRAH